MAKKSIVHEKAMVFALEIVGLYKILQEQRELVLSKQLLRSGTAVGANICEALAGYSRRDFLYKMTIASKECRETQYWLKLLKKSQLVNYNYNKELLACNELNSILTSIVKTTSESLDTKAANETKNLKTEALNSEPKIQNSKPNP